MEKCEIQMNYQPPRKKQHVDESNIPSLSQVLTSSTPSAPSHVCYHLPKDLVSNILSFLPLELLIRREFGYVSKEWLSAHHVSSLYTKINFSLNECAHAYGRSERKNDNRFCHARWSEFVLAPSSLRAAICEGIREVLLFAASRLRGSERDPINLGLLVPFQRNPIKFPNLNYLRIDSGYHCTSSSSLQEALVALKPLFGAREVIIKGISTSPNIFSANNIFFLLSQFPRLRAIGYYSSFFSDRSLSSIFPSRRVPGQPGLDPSMISRMKLPLKCFPSRESRDVMPPTVVLPALRALLVTWEAHQESYHVANMLVYLGCHACALHTLVMHICQGDLQPATDWTEFKHTPSGLAHLVVTLDSVDIPSDMSPRDVIGMFRRLVGENSDTKIHIYLNHGDKPWPDHIKDRSLGYRCHTEFDPWAEDLRCGVDLDSEAYNVDTYTQWLSRM